MSLVSIGLSKVLLSLKGSRILSKQVTGCPRRRPSHPLASISTSSTTVAYNLPTDLEKLKPLDMIHLNQTMIRFHHDELQKGCSIGGTSTIELDAVSSENKVLFKIEFFKGEAAKEYLINLYGVGKDKPLLVEMELERCIQHRAFILRVRSPPGNLIGSIYELAGISQVGIVENERSETILQVITNGGFGWATSALILNGDGSRRLGRMDKKTTEGAKNELSAKIIFPSYLKTSDKVTLIGACLTFMGRYHL